MNTSRTERNPSLDVIRVVACFGVVSVHFLLNNGFYDEIIGSDPLLYPMVFFRSLFMFCVPLFMILSGYLLCHKTLSLGYYKRLGKILFIYVAASLFCIYGYAFLHGILKGVLGLSDPVTTPPHTIFGVIAKILGFTAAPYSWYVEMYLGLFLIVPFINLIYGNLPTQRAKRMLILAFIVLTVLPTIVNVYNFTVDGWWGNPAMLNENNEQYAFQQIIPAWWTGMYPVTYYFIGCYLREYKIDIASWKLALMLVSTVAVSGLYSIWRSYGTTFIWGPWTTWNSLFNLVVGTLVFLLFLNADYTQMPGALKTLFAKLSALCLSTYLVSWVFDNLFYPVLKAHVATVGQRLPYYFFIVPLVFVCSMGISYLIEKLYDLTQLAKRYIVDRTQAGKLAA